MILIDRDENYWSNWFRFYLPKYLYLHVFDYFSDSLLNTFEYPVLRDQDFLLSFARQECFKGIFSIKRTEEIKVMAFLRDREYKTLETGYLIKDTNNKIIHLLNDAFPSFLLDKGLKEYSLSSGKAYYFSKNLSNDSPILKISLKKYGKRFVQLIGKTEDFNWHFGVEGKAFLYPINAYFITYHVVFTKEGILVDKKKQHSLRRGLGKKMVQ